MPTQTLIWTCLPNGISGAVEDRVLHLSVLVSPRLRLAEGEGNELAAFPDFLDWPARLGQASLRVAFANGPTLEASPTSAPDSTLWTALFAPDSLVRPFVFDDHSARQIVSYPVRRILGMLQSIYGRFALQVDRMPFPDELRSTLEAFSIPWNQDWAAIARDALAPGADNSPPEVVARALLFHRPLDLRPGDERLPETPEDFRDLVDFHEAVASITDFPAIGRQIGLLLDLDVPIGALPDGSIPRSGEVRLEVTWPAESPTINYAPVTAYLMEESRFEARSRSGSVSHGLAILDAKRYGLVQVDVDGAVLKVNQLSLNLPPDQDVSGVGLPTLRSSGLALVFDGRADYMRERFATSSAANSALESDPPAAVTLFAEDLLRGFRVDIWDSRTQAWHSLCRRIGTYRFVEAGIEQVVEDEGWMQTGATLVPSPQPDAPDDLILPESLLRWDGWSLVAPRPGKAINRVADPSAPPERPENEPATPFSLAASFKAVPGSLPSLRFGAEYRIRARTVDLAGNGLGFSNEDETLTLPAAPNSFPYLRFDPVPPPVVVLRTPLSATTTPGESLERLVIRSFNAHSDDDASPTPFVGERHLAPPRTSQLGAEVHSRLDAPNGALRVDAVTYQMLRTKDEGELTLGPPDPATPNAPSMPVEPAAQLSLPYLPDPLASGIAFRALPGAQEGVSRASAGSTLDIVEAPEGGGEAGAAVVIVGFGDRSAWPELQPFRLVLVEGNDPPKWDTVNRALTIGIPKAAVTTVTASCLLERDDLELMAIWSWIRDEIAELERTYANNPEDLARIAMWADVAVRKAVSGGHWMLTPVRPLTLVHAVQQPLGHPEFGELRAERTQNGATAAILLGRMAIHGQSTSKVDIVASWTEPVDRLDEPEPRVLEATVAADEVALRDLRGGLVSGHSGADYVGNYDPDTDEVVFNDDAHPRQEFGDTKHRMVRYAPLATSRFREYFLPDVAGGVTRLGDDVVVNVPSSARPDAPRPLYVIPTFAWERATSPNMLASRRRGGMRVYLERPWFSSGEDELLGVVYSSKLEPTTSRADRERLTPFVTQRGFDPVHRSQASSGTLGTLYEWSFPDAEVHAKGLLLGELPDTPLDVAAFRPAYAADRQLWYCDIAIDNGDTYFPFVKLALARYQPNAIAGVELSPVAVTNIAQIAPNRSLVVAFNPYEAGVINVSVSGFTYQEPNEALRTEIEVWAERQYDPALGELGWGFTPDVTVTSSVDAVNVTGPLLWQGQVHLPEDRAPGEYRVTVKEFERYLGDAEEGDQPLTIQRLVYAEALPV